MAESSLQVVGAQAQPPPGPDHDFYIFDDFDYIFAVVAGFGLIMVGAVVTVVALAWMASRLLG